MTEAPKETRCHFYRLAEIAAMTGFSEEWVRTHLNDGTLPKSFRAGRTLLWHRDQIDRWIAEGCPKVEQ